MIIVGVDDNSLFQTLSLRFIIIVMVQCVFDVGWTSVQGPTLINIIVNILLLLLIIIIIIML